MLNIRKAFSNKFYEVNQNIEKNEKLLSEMFLKLASLENNINNLENNINNLSSQKWLDDKFNGIFRELSEINQLKQEMSNNEFLLKESLSNSYKIIGEFKYTNLEYLNLKNIVDNTRKNVLLIGFYGAPNLGDELMLETMLEKIKLLGNFNITVMLSENIDYDITKLPKCNIIHFPKNLLDINTLADCFDVFIFGGGAIIDDYQYPVDYQMSLGQILVNLTLRAITYNKKILLYGLSSNISFHDEEYIQKLRLISKGNIEFSLRDSNSLETLKKYEINTNNIEVVHDIVLANRKLNLVNKNKNSKKIKLGIIYICSENNYSKLIDITKDIISIIDNNNYDYEINFIPFYNYLNNDTKYYQKIIDEVGLKKSNLKKFPNNFQEIINVLNEQDIILSMRYHGTLLSGILNKNIINLIFDEHRHYKNKCNYLKDNYKINDATCNFSELTFETLEHILLSMIKNKKKKKKHDYTRILKEADEQINKALSKVLLEVEDDKN